MHVDRGYSLLTISGFKEHLEVHKVRLPLKYPKKKSKVNVTEIFQDRLSGSGGLIEVNKSGGSFIDTVAYDIGGDLRTVTLTPVNSQPNNLDLPFQRLQIELPHRIHSRKCISIQAVEPAEEADSEVFFVVDLLDENRLFITLKISLSDFVVSRSPRLTIENFNEWGNISIPYSFELRTFAFSLKALDSLNIVVSLKDGGLLHFQRPSILDDFDVYNFSDSNSLIPLNLISGIFKKSSKKTEVVLDGISSSSVVDFYPINRYIFAALTVDKVLKFWSLQTHEQVSNSIDVGDISDEQSRSGWLSSLPARHLQVYEDSTTGKKYLAVYYTDSSKTDEIPDKSAIRLRTWEILDRDTQLELISLPKFDLDPEIPTYLLNYGGERSTPRNSIWFVQDFVAQINGSSLQYHLLWKSNTSTVPISYTLNVSTADVSEVKIYSSNNNNFYNDFTHYQDEEFYATKILDSGSYSDLIIVSALNIYRDHLGLNPVEGTDTIRKDINESIQTAETHHNQHKRDCWIKLYSLCEELKKSSEECLALQVSEKGLMYLQSDGLAILEKSHYFQSFFQYEKSEGNNKLSSLLDRLCNTVSAKSYFKIFKEATTLETLNSKSANDIFEKFLKNKVTEEEINGYMAELSSIPDAIDIITSLLDPKISYDDMAVDGQNDSNTANIGLLTKLHTISSIRNIKISHQIILIKLLVLLLICEANDTILSLINKIISRLSIYTIFEYVMDVCFHSQSAFSVEKVTISRPEYSLFWNGVISKNPGLNFLVKKGKIIDAYNVVYEKVIMSYDQFLVDVVIELINCNEGKIIKNKFFRHLNKAKPLDRFITGLVHLINNEPGPFYEIFKDFEYYKQYSNPEVLEKLVRLTVNPNIRHFLNSAFSDEEDSTFKKANYYHSLSELSKSRAQYPHGNVLDLSSTSNDYAEKVDSKNDFRKSSLEFEKNAIQILKESTDKGERVKQTTKEFYINIFDVSLVLNDFELAYESMSFLTTPDIADNETVRALLTKLIITLIKGQSFSVLFVPERSKLFKEHYLLIDSILLELANNELTLSSSLRYYELIYSWRLFGSSKSLASSDVGDKRGAIESLYMFITRFKNEHSNLIAESVSNVEDVKQYRLKILELYLIILNCLKSFQNDDDKWIVRSQDESSLSVVGLDQLSLEYFEWLQQLQVDLREEL